MDLDAKIYVAGHRGLVGSALVRALHAKGHRNLLLKTRRELDLCDQGAVDDLFQQHRPDYVFLAAAKVGGILANDTYRAQFIHDNLSIALSVIRAAHASGVHKLLNLGSSCIYPRMAKQPICEDSLLSGPLEPTNRSYAIAKIAAIELCDAYRSQYGCDFVSAMPTNLYGPGDNFDPHTSHVIPAMIHAFEQARVDRTDVIMWGTGEPRRDFLHVDDLAQACLVLMDDYSEPGPINIGSGTEISIRALAAVIADITEFAGQIQWDTSKPTGTPRKLLNTSRIQALGWCPQISLEDGLRTTLRWFRRSARRLTTG